MVRSLPGYDLANPYTKEFVIYTDREVTKGQRETEVHGAGSIISLSFATGLLVGASQQPWSQIDSVLDCVLFTGSKM